MKRLPKRPSPTSPRTTRLRAEKLARDTATYGPEFAARLADWDAGGPELTEEESARYREGLDFDEVIVNAYVEKRLPEDVAAAVENRLKRDADFRADFGSYIRLATDGAFMTLLGGLMRSVKE